MSCTCDNPTQTKTITCFNRAKCSNMWNVDKSHHEITASCPEHYRSVSICGGGQQLCTDCTKNGYKLQFIGGFPPTYRVINDNM